MYLVRFAFWMLYNPLAWTYDWVSQIVSLGRWHDWQRSSLSEIRGRRVLELGFGTGEMLLDLRARDYDVAGLDLSRRMAHIAGQKLDLWGANVPLVRGLGQRLPFADASFDTVLSTFPSEFIIRLETLSEIARVLCPGGRAVIVALAQFTPDTVGTWILELLYRITGQRQPVPDLNVQARELGLAQRIVWKPVGKASVLLVLLEKTGIIGYRDKLDHSRSTDD
jgi:ubiquinone/menaquinone biosynthesis C-methylase UbiE